LSQKVSMVLIYSHSLSANLDMTKSRFEKSRF
jgi:hypothetical protein